jgi:hypothetical protein
MVILAAVVASQVVVPRAAAAEPRGPQMLLTRERSAAGAWIVRAGGKDVFHYQIERPAGAKLPVESGGFFHPVMTPSGTVVTDLAPSDHPHHRGIFLAWVEMHGQKDADFWGWGEHAPIKGRRIVHEGVRDTLSGGDLAYFDAYNDWVADGQVLLREVLHVEARADPSAAAHVIDLTYKLTPTADLLLSRWAFSGFCVRTRGDGKLTAHGPRGEVKLPNPSHVSPESDWPAAAWYGYTLKFDDGKAAGVAVIDHPQNPPSLWHNHRDVRMLNPCIVAPGAVKLKARQPLVLRYRVVAHDGETPGEALDRLAAAFREEETRGQGDKGTR